jgi:predicted DNA-binding transcriptional regulator AlpA
MTSKARSRLAASQADRARVHRDRRAALPDQSKPPQPDAQSRPHVIRGPPPTGPRLLNRAEVVARVGVSFPTLWAWMRKGKFPRSRQIGNSSRWLSDEVDDFLRALPVRKLKGDE